MPSAELDWHFEPLTRLAVLHRDFSAGKHVSDHVLAIGCAAGVLKVAEAITAAHINEQLTRQGNPDRDTQAKIRHDAVARTVSDLHNVEELRELSDGRTELPPLSETSGPHPNDGASSNGTPEPQQIDIGPDTGLESLTSLGIMPSKNRTKSVSHPTWPAPLPSRLCSSQGTTP